LTLPLLVVGLGYHLATGGGSGLMTALQGAALPMAILSIPYLMGIMGAGDVKLMMAFGAWLGPETATLLLALGLGFTAVYSFGLLAWQGRLRDSWATFHLAMFQLSTIGQNFSAEGENEYESVRDVVKVPNRRQRLVPFSVMVAIGVVIALFLGEELMQLLPRMI